MRTLSHLRELDELSKTGIDTRIFLLKSSRKIETKEIWFFMQ